MNATRINAGLRAPAQPASAGTDGILVAPLVGDGWAAIEELRRRMRAVRGGPRVVFLIAIDDRGRLVPPGDPSASHLALGYRLQVRAAKRT